MTLDDNWLQALHSKSMEEIVLDQLYSWVFSLSLVLSPVVLQEMYLHAVRMGRIRREIERELITQAPAQPSLGIAIRARIGIQF